MLVRGRGLSLYLVFVEDLVESIVDLVVVIERNHDPDAVEEDEHKPEVLEVEIAVKPGWPVL